MSAGHQNERWNISTAQHTADSLPAACSPLPLVAGHDAHCFVSWLWTGLPSAMARCLFWAEYSLSRHFPVICSKQQASTTALHA